MSYDRRDYARDRHSPIVAIINDEIHQVPTEWVICDLCDGEGKHVNPSIDSHGISAQEFAEDPDFEESYFRGDYDVPCRQCAGTGKVREVIVSKCSFAIKRQMAERRRNERQQHEWDVQEAHERRMGY